MAVIGAGIGGCFAAKFLREKGGKKLDIHLFAKKDSKVGGRTAVFEFDGHVFETGASVIHSSNKYLSDVAKEHGKWLVFLAGRGWGQTKFNCGSRAGSSS